ncbi:MAG: hypothetical protein K2H28_06405, partial [Ruminococcus sp.]|nr:hypothetical protein [Ruminococcus sp.]
MSDGAGISGDIPIILVFSVFSILSVIAVKFPPVSVVETIHAHAEELSGRISIRLSLITFTESTLSNYCTG